MFATMAKPVVYFWKKTPFLRLLPPLAAGIAIETGCQLLPVIWWILSAATIFFITAFFFISFFQRYKAGWVTGINVAILFISLGALLTWYNDIRHNGRWFKNFYDGHSCMVISLDEPLSEKANSFKADARAHYIIKGNKTIPVAGKIIVYFKKEKPGQNDAQLRTLSYGTEIIFNKPVQEIKGGGNPAGFDYKQYCLFQGITHQVYLQSGEFEILSGKKKNIVTNLLYLAEKRVLGMLSANIKKEKERGLAEALLIGYKDDLDKSLVQSYSNTGVVHIIAISGMHLGLIYWLLVQLFRPLRKIKYARLLQPIIVVVGLWLFSLLAGGQPSVLRSAVMFTCIVLAQSLKRKTSIYNTLAFSAFILLCYDPYWLRDAGFQLSYAAVLSIVIFMKPVYNWFYIKNKWLDLVWKANAVSIAAQVLTVPITIYHFHQFPVYFLATNLIAVPLSSIIVLGEILLCTVSFIPFVALIIGKILLWLIRIMDEYVHQVELLPFSLWDGLQVNIYQATLLFIVTGGLGVWLMEKRKHGLMVALFAGTVFFSIRSYSFFNTGRQQKIIVYNVPKHKAIDFIDGRHFVFVGDTELQSDEYSRNFYFRATRILNRVSPEPPIKDLVLQGKYVVYKAKRILFADTSLSFEAMPVRYDLDLLIISGAARLYISKLSRAFKIKRVVFDGTVSSGKLFYWKKDCDSLGIPYYDVNEKGAFVMNLN